MAAVQQRQEELQQRYANPLCAGCGCALMPDYWQPPETSLCPTCEDKVRLGKMAWPDPKKS